MKFGHLLEQVLRFRRTRYFFCKYGGRRCGSYAVLIFRFLLLAALLVAVVAYRCWLKEIVLGSEEKSGGYLFFYMNIEYCYCVLVFLRLKRLDYQKLNFKVWKLQTILGISPSSFSSVFKYVTYGDQINRT